MGGLAAAAAGIVVLFLCSLRETLVDPSLSLEDGYWIGRLPWTAGGVDLVVIGATVAVVAGTIAAWIAGGWVRRSVTTLAAGIAAFWWFLVLVTNPGGGYCAGCPGPGFDPFTMARSTRPLPWAPDQDLQKDSVVGARGGVGPYF